MSVTRTDADVDAMINRLEAAHPGGSDEMDAVTEGIYEALLWFTGNRDDTDLTSYFEEVA